jgi:large subunit ribosomal protein L3
MIGKKIGMTRIFKENGTVVPVTALKVGPCKVTQVKTEDKEGYNAIQLGYEESKRLNKPIKGHLKGNGGFRYLREFRVDDLTDMEVGQQITVDMFEPGERVDIIGTSKGRGFAGNVKRHGFAGSPKTHGTKDQHRASGSVGGGTYPGKTWKGQRMAGHMGNSRVTVKGLEVVQANPDRNLLLIKGAIPGHRNSLVLIEKISK